MPSADSRRARRWANAVTTRQTQAVAAARSVGAAAERRMSPCCGTSAASPSSHLAGFPLTPRVRDPRQVALGMVAIRDGSFLMGGDDADAFLDDGEGPVREVTLSAFLIDALAVTNGQFAAFVADTNYVTDAEQFGWSFVFRGMVDAQASGTTL